MAMFDCAEPYGRSAGYAARVADSGMEHNGEKNSYKLIDNYHPSGTTDDLAVAGVTERFSIEPATARDSVVPFIINLSASIII